MHPPFPTAPACARGDHPPRALVNPLPVRWTGGPDAVWVADCSACGERSVVIDPLVAPGPAAAAAPSSTCPHDRR